MQLKIPVSVKNANDILEYGYNAQEKLRLLHNAEGQKVGEGKITLDQFREWQYSYFDPRSDAISVVIVNARKQLLTSNKYAIDLEGDFI